MALPLNLQQDLLQALGTFRAFNAPSVLPTAPGRALEAWLLLRLAQAAHTSGDWWVSLRRGDDSQLPIGDMFVFPTHQSEIKAPDPGGKGHVLLVSRLDPSVRLEIHNSLQWKGRSEATHECDISVLPFVVADSLRSAGGGWPCGLPIVAYECKDQPRPGSTDEVRETLARLFDLVLVTKPGGTMACRLFSPSGPVPWGRWRSTYRSFFNTGSFAIVRVGKFSTGADALAGHYHIEEFGELYKDPNIIVAIERKFRETIASAAHM